MVLVKAKDAEKIECGFGILLFKGVHMTRKIVTIVIVIALSGLMLSLFSCASEKKAAGKVEGLPEWYLNPPIAEDAIYGVGSAKMSSLDMSRTMAISRARDDVARQMEVLVKSAILDYAQEAGVSFTGVPMNILTKAQFRPP